MAVFRRNGSLIVVILFNNAVDDTVVVSETKIGKLKDNKSGAHSSSCVMCMCDDDDDGVATQRRAHVRTNL